ncbi:MAG: PD40 domain-containing protein [Planctomycetes bacterium]|nr:PD40 domain-containing protein [Planctomycetota bacterium]
MSSRSIVVLLAAAFAVGGCSAPWPDDVHEKGAGLGAPGDQPYLSVEQHTRDGCASVQPTLMGDNEGRPALVYAGDKDAKYFRIYRKALPQNSAVETLVHVPNANAMDPAVSPSGKLIAFASDLSGRWDVYVAMLDDVHATMRNVTKEMTDFIEARHPTWSPDGQWLCFHALVPKQAQYRLQKARLEFVMPERPQEQRIEKVLLPAAGGQAEPGAVGDGPAAPVLLVAGPGEAADHHAGGRDMAELGMMGKPGDHTGAAPRGSPPTGSMAGDADGEPSPAPLHFEVVLKGLWDIGEGRYPEWRPLPLDGSTPEPMIAFQQARERDGGLYSLWTMNPDGGMRREVYSASGLYSFGAINPTWSPGGTALAFASSGKSAAQAGKLLHGDDIYILSLRDNAVRQVTFDERPEWNPVWHDGRIYYTMGDPDAERHTIAIMSVPAN